MSNVATVNDNSFETEVLQSQVPVVVDLWAEWCGPCRVLSPIVDELAGELGDRVKFVKVNVDQNPQVAQRFGIQSIPTLLFFKGGEVVGQEIGLVPKDELRKRVANHLGV